MAPAPNGDATEYKQVIFGVIRGREGGLDDELADTLQQDLTTDQGCIKLLDFSLSSLGWRRGLGRGGLFLLVSPLLIPLPARSSQGEDGELDAALTTDLKADSILANPPFNMRGWGSEICNRMRSDKSAGL